MAARGSARVRWTAQHGSTFCRCRTIGANPRDAVVHVVFDRGDRAVWIVPANIGELNETGSSPEAALSLGLQPTARGRG